MMMTTRTTCLVPIGLIIPRGQSVSGHVVQGKMWDLDKNLLKVRQKRDSSKHWFTRRYLDFQVKNTPLKETDGKGKFKRMLSFLLVDKGRLFFTKLSFEEFKFQKISVIGAIGLFWNATKQRSFWRIFRYILYSLVKKITFLNNTWISALFNIFVVLTYLTELTRICFDASSATW